jgi:hypothetical protein
MDEFKHVYLAWVEGGREYKARVMEQLMENLLTKNTVLEDLYNNWDKLVNSTLERWKGKSQTLVSKYIEKEGGARVVSTLRKKFDEFIEKSVEMDEKLKEHHFAIINRQIRAMQSQLKADFLKLSILINELLFNKLNDAKNFIVLNQKENTLTKIAHKKMEDVNEEILRWFRDTDLSMYCQGIEDTFYKLVVHVKKSQDVILKEHSELWEILDDKFKLAGPEKIMKEIVSKGDDCEIFDISNVDFSKFLSQEQ